MFPCTAISSSNTSFPAVLRWQKKAMIFDVPGPTKPERGHIRQNALSQNCPFVSSRLEHLTKDPKSHYEGQVCGKIDREGSCLAIPPARHRSLSGPSGPKCPWSVPENGGCPSECPTGCPRGPSGPGDTPSDTPLDTPHFGGHSRARRARETPVPGRRDRNSCRKAAGSP